MTRPCRGRDACRHLFFVYLITCLALVCAPAASVFAVGGISLINSDQTSLRFTADCSPAFVSDIDDDSISTVPRRVVLVGLPPAGTVASLSAGATVLGTKTVRGRSIAYLALDPAMAGPNGHIAVTVQFGRPKAATVESRTEPLFDAAFAAGVVNAEDWLDWGALVRPRQKVVAAGPFAGSSQWVKVELSSTGVYRVDNTALRALVGTAAIPSASLKLHTGGGRQVPVLNSEPRPTLREVAVDLIDGGDGLFDNNDYFLFFGEGPDRFVFDSSGTVSFSNHHYSSVNVYWLEISSGTGGMRMATVDGSITGTADTTILDFTNHLHIEQDNVLLQRYDGRTVDYYRWFWVGRDSLNFSLATPGLKTGTQGSFTLTGETRFANTGIDLVGYTDLYVNGVAGQSKSCDQDSCRYVSAALIDGTNQIRLMMYGNSIAPPYFDHFEVRYLADLLPVSGRLDAPLGRLSALAEFEVVDGFSGAVRIWDVTNPQAPVIVRNAVQSAGLVRFERQLSGAAFNRFYLTGPAQVTTPVLNLETPTDLYASATQTDLIIVTTPALSGALTEYITYRSEQGYSIRTVHVDDIYDNFSFGLQDPTAIRDFLKLAYETFPDPAPSMVLFVGDANYDYVDNLGTGVSNVVPANIHEFDQTSSDDNYVYFGAYGLLDNDSSFAAADRGYDMMTARWPVRTAQEIQTITAKIRRYESPEEFGDWRNRITFVADDELGTFPNETVHTRQTDSLALLHVPLRLDRDKIYLIEYPRINNLKPDVNRAIRKSLDDGTLLINYVGHGNPDVWAGERIFTRTDDVPRLNNADRLPLFFNASCAIGFFDDPEREGMAEDLLAAGPTGAIGVVSATRLVFSLPNSIFNRQVFDILLQSDTLTIAQAVYVSKLLRQYPGLPGDSLPRPEANDRNYLYFGDPLLHLGMPHHEISFTDRPDSLTALQPVRVTGQVVDRSGQPVLLDGTLDVMVLDSERDKTFRIFDDDGGFLGSVDYTMPGPTLFRGRASVTGGSFAVDFIPPLDIGFGGEGARVQVYANLGSTDGSGVVAGIPVSSTVKSSTDSTGPSISISFDGGGEFVSGDVIAPEQEMIIRLADSSGINLAGGIGHGITLEIDNLQQNTTTLNGQFAYDLDDYTQGSLRYSLSELEPGVHSLKVKAWDNANNSSTYEFDVELAAAGVLAVRELLPYPNPMRDATTFSFYVTDRVGELTLDIFTLSGKKIQSFRRRNLEPGYYDDIRWSRTDADGDRVAAAVYIYKLTALPVSGGDHVEEFGKVVVVN